MAGKAQIVEHVANKVDGLTKKQAAAALDAVVGAIQGQLRRGERVQVPGLGSFSVSQRPARRGRNPKTGAAIHIPASRSVRFKAGKDLKEGLNR